MIETIDKQPLRGMRDFLPLDWVFRKKLMRAWTEAAEQSGFVRYETPIVEPLALLERKSGEEISSQIYNFEDKSGRKIALRPEITPSMVRIVSGNREAFPAQGKVYSIGQCFRYERASLGRKREHFQWNIDIIGETRVVAEAYLLKTAVLALNKLGFSACDFQIHVNNRALVSAFLSGLGMDQEKSLAVMGVMDKKDKVSPDDFKAMLSEVGASDEQIASVCRFMTAKDLKEIETFVSADSPAMTEMRLFLSYCAALSISDYVMVDTGIVRGLAYYTGIVFEAFDTNRKFRAIFGGGRYDNLFEKLTGKASAAVGLGFGDVVIEELDKDRNAPQPADVSVDVLIGAYSDQITEALLNVSKILSDSDVSADCDFKPSAMGKFLSRADKRYARVAAYIGEREYGEGKILLKNMATGDQVVVTMDENLPAEIKKFL